MDFSTCNLRINNDIYIICSFCNKYIHLQMVYRANIMKTNWSNKSTTTYNIQIFR